MSEWIEISKQMPKYGHMILACSNNGVIHIVVVGDRIWNDYMSNTEYKFGETCFTHWMELPELPDVYKN